MWMLLWLALAATPLGQEPAVARAVRPSEPVSAKVWIDRYEEIERFLATADIVRVEDVGTGVTRPQRAFFAPGGPAGSVVVKNLPPGRRNGYWESYKSEIAAYRLDRLLDLNMVPPTVERRVGGNLVSVQLWLDGTQLLKTVQDKGLRAPDSERWNREVYRQRVFSDLVGNIDVNAGNLLIDPAWNLVLVDHSRAFDRSRMPFPLTRIDRPFFDRLKALDADRVREELRDLLSGREISELLKRRDEIVATFEALAAKNGAARVFLP